MFGSGPRSSIRVGQRMVSAATKQHVNLLVVASPETPELSVLKQLPAEVKVVATGQTLEDLSKQLSDEQWGSIDVLLNCGVGKFAGKREYIQVCHPHTLCTHPLRMRH